MTRLHTYTASLDNNGHAETTHTPTSNDIGTHVLTAQYPEHDIYLPSTATAMITTVHFGIVPNQTIISNQVTQLQLYTANISKSITFKINGKTQRATSGKLYVTPSSGGVTIFEFTPSNVAGTYPCTLSTNVAMSGGIVNYKYEGQITIQSA